MSIKNFCDKHLKNHEADSIESLMTLGLESLHMAFQLIVQLPVWLSILWMTGRAAFEATTFIYSGGGLESLESFILWLLWLFCCRGIASWYRKVFLYLDLNSRDKGLIEVMKNSANKQIDDLLGSGRAKRQRKQLVEKI